MEYRGEPVKGKFISFPLEPYTLCLDFLPLNHQKFDKIKTSNTKVKFLVSWEEENTSLAQQGTCAASWNKTFT